LRPVDADASVVVNTTTGERGDVAEWVELFGHVWDAPRERLDRLLDLLSPDIVLKAPTYPPETRGREAGRAAFLRAFRAMPDLRADVHCWAASGDLVFIEFTSSATIGGRRVEWTSVDRFIFRDGLAVERVNYFNPAHVRKAFLRSPGAVWQLLRLRFGF
jgi:ketosteroid isomerase-like protein